MQRVKDKVIIITGAASGIGRATAILCAQQGAKVAVTDVRDDQGKKVVKEIEAGGGNAHFWHINTSDEKEVQKVFNEINKEFGKIDVLVNNAGIPGANKPTDEMTEAEWDAVMAVNVKGVFLCTKHVIPYLKINKQGSIINLSSIYGITGARDIPAYHASKGAVRLMSKTDAMFYARDKIRVNSVHPGFIWTAFTESFGKNFPGGIEAYRKHMGGLHPLGRMGDPNDIAYGILYLASDESTFITGSELIIDGGYTAR